MPNHSCEYLEKLEAQVEELKNSKEVYVKAYEDLSMTAEALKQENYELKTIVEQFKHLYEEVKIGMLFKPGTVSNKIYTAGSVDKFIEECKSNKSI